MEPSAGPWARHRWAELAIVAVLLVFARTIGFGFVNWDDGLHVLSNPLVFDGGRAPWDQLLLTPRLGYPIPLTVFSYRLEAAAVGASPWLYHTTNLALHLGSVVLVLHLGQRLGLGTAGAMTAALVFGLHPATAEPVSWVSGRKDLLALFLALASAASFVRSEVGRGRVWRLASLLLFVAAVLAKPTALFLPLALVLLPPPGDRPALGRRLISLIPFAVAAAMLVVVAYLGQKAGGAVQEVGSAGAWLRQIWYGFGYHLGLALLFQPPLAKHIPASLPPPFVPAIDLAPLAVALAGLAVWTIARRGGARLPAAAMVGLGWAAFAYLPSAGVIPLNRFVADSYVYPCLPGLGWALGSLVDHLWSLPRTRTTRLLAAAALLVVLLLASRTFFASANWRDSVSLWTSVYRRYPDSPQVCRNLGNALVEAGTPLAAVDVYQDCGRRLGPVYFAKNLGIILLRLGRPREAVLELSRAAAARPGDPVIRRYLQLANQQAAGAATSPPPPPADEVSGSP